MRKLALALCGIALAGLSGCGSLNSLNPTNWWGEEESRKPTELTPITEAVGVGTRWTASIGSGADKERVALVVAVDGGRVYAANREGEVRAFDAATGAAFWTVETQVEVSGGPGVGGGLVVVGSRDADLIALDAATGAERWRARVSSEVLASPKVGSDAVVVQTNDGRLAAYAAANGTLMWTFDRPAPALTLQGNSAPVIDGSQVIAGSDAGKLAAIDLTTGQPRWETSIALPHGRSDLERMVDIDGDPLLLEGAVFAVTYQGQMAAVDSNRGQIFWRKDMSSHSGIGGDTRTLAVADADDLVYGLDPRSGSALWKQEALKYRRLSPPAVVSGYVVVGDFEGFVHFLDRNTGALVGRIQIDSSPITAKPIVDGGTVYILTDGGDLAAISAGG